MLDTKLPLSRRTTLSHRKARNTFLLQQLQSLLQQLQSWPLRIGAVKVYYGFILFRRSILGQMIALITKLP
jgi:hypothetical protein